MPVEPWPTVVVGGKEYWEVDGKFRVAKESDPNAQVLILIGTPNGGIANVGPLVQGDPGQHAEIDEEVNITAVLEYDDPTPDSMSWTTLTPPDEDTPGVYRLNSTQRKGPAGEDGDTVLTPADYGSPLAGQFLVVKGDLSGFELASQKIPSRHVPATIVSVPSGNANYTMATISIAAKTYDYRPIVFAHTIITGTGADVAVDLVCRMGAESGDNIVARCIGLPGAKDRLTIVSALAAGSGDSFDKVTAGNAKNFYLRTERSTGADTYTTSNTTTFFEIWAMPV